MSSQGSTNLLTLIRTMTPTLSPPTYIFAHIPSTTASTSQTVLQLLTTLPIQMLYKEDEGWTAILEQDVAETAGVKGIFPCKKITLNVHSSLEAVGFMAAVTTELTRLGVGVNPVSGFFHDHLFVPVGREGEVMEALERMAKEAQEGS